MANFIYYAICSAFLTIVVYLFATSVHRYVRESRHHKDGWKDLFFAVASGLSLICLILSK